MRRAVAGTEVWGLLRRYGRGAGGTRRSRCAPVDESFRAPCLRRRFVARPRAAPETPEAQVTDVVTSRRDLAVPSVRPHGRRVGSAQRPQSLHDLAQQLRGRPPGRPVPAAAARRCIRDRPRPDRRAAREYDGQGQVGVGGELDDQPGSVAHQGQQGGAGVVDTELPSSVRRAVTRDIRSIVCRSEGRVRPRVTVGRTIDPVSSSYQWSSVTAGSGPAEVGGQPYGGGHVAADAADQQRHLVGELSDVRLHLAQDGQPAAVARRGDEEVGVVEHHHGLAHLPRGEAFTGRAGQAVEAGADGGEVLDVPSAHAVRAAQREAVGGEEHGLADVVGPGHEVVEQPAEVRAGRFGGGAQGLGGPVGVLGGLVAEHRRRPSLPRCRFAARIRTRWAGPCGRGRGRAGRRRRPRGPPRG